MAMANAIDQHRIIGVTNMRTLAHSKGINPGAEGD